MESIERAARALCALDGKSGDELSESGAPVWQDYVAQVGVVVKALHEPTTAMCEAGAEIVRVIGAEEEDFAYQQDAANIWRYMADTLLSDINRKP